MKYFISLLTCSLGLVALFLLSIGSGSHPIPVSELFSILTFREVTNPVWQSIVWDLRIPRALTAALAGSALALAGLQMQTVFRNPLADPFVLGINSGASLGVALVLLLFLPSSVGFWMGGAFSHSFILVVAASLGSGGVLLVMLLFSTRVGVMTLLILGLMLSYLIGAFVSILLFFSMPEQLQSFLTWTFGQFSAVTWQHLYLLFPIIPIAIVAGCLRFKFLDALLLGEEEAQTIGENLLSGKIWVLSTSAILAGTVTAFCGPIAFVGVAVPHLAKGLLQTNSHKELLPFVLIMGAMATLFADWISRLPGHAYSLPVNAVTAIIGAPVIIWVLLNRRYLS